jgi:hypothetical protein
MDSDYIPSTNQKKMMPKSSFASCIDEELPCRGFQLRRRPSSFCPISKHATKTTPDYIQLQRSVESGIDRFESAFRTPYTVKSLEIPPEIKLPLFDDIHQMRKVSEKKRKIRRDYSSVRVDLSNLFDAVEDTLDKNRPARKSDENRFECCSRFH